MKKTFLLLSLIASLALTAAPLFAASTEEELGYDLPVQVYSATVTLLGIETLEGFTYLSLKLPGDEGEEVVRASKNCFFCDERQNSISAADFLGRYKGTTVTVEFGVVGYGEPNFYTIDTCRPGNR